MEEFLAQFEQHPQIQEYLQRKGWSYNNLIAFSTLSTLPSQFPDLDEENERNLLVDAILELRMEEFIRRFHKYPEIQTFLRNQNLRYDHILALSESSSVELLADKLSKRGFDELYSMYLAKMIISLRSATSYVASAPIVHFPPPIDLGEIETSAIITVMPIHPKLKRGIASCMLTQKLTGEISKGVELHKNQECILVKVSGKYRRIQTFCLALTKLFPVECTILPMGWTNFTDVKILQSHDKINLKEGDQSDITSGTSGDDMKVFATIQQYQEKFEMSFWERVSSTSDSVTEQFGYPNFRSGVGQNPEHEVRVLIKNLGEYKLLSKNNTTWEGCFDEFSDQPVSAVYVLNNTEKAKIGEPNLLRSGDIIEIEFKKETYRSQWFHST